MFIDDSDDGADSYCVRCGAAIYFEVGFGSSICPSCGKDSDHTDEQLRRLEEEASKPTDYIGQIGRDVDSLEFYLDSMILNAPKDFKIDKSVVVTARKIRDLAEKMKAVLRDHRKSCG